MIYLFLGGVGSGKTVSVVRRIVRSDKPVFINFNIKWAGCTKLKLDNIIKSDLEGNKVVKSINWDFWRDARRKGGFHIFLDEFHNIMHSRSSMSRTNVLLSKWISQIRKITSGSQNDLVVISQELERIDISLRDLAHQIIHCSLITKKNKIVKTACLENDKKVFRELPKFYVLQRWFTGISPCERYRRFRDGMAKPSFSTAFFANPYFQYYDSLELIDFESEI